MKNKEDPVACDDSLQAYFLWSSQYYQFMNFAPFHLTVVSVNMSFSFMDVEALIKMDPAPIYLWSPGSLMLFCICACVRI